MVAWPTKDPFTVADYRFDVPLDADDVVSSITIARLSGTVTIDSQAGDDGGITAWLSGGVHGETSVFRIYWTTDGGRAFDEIVTLLVADNAITALSGYDKPGAAHLKARYHAFASIDAATIQYWLTDAERSVDESWPERDYATAIMALAAHNMATAGIVKGAVPAGVTRFKSGSMDVTIAESVAASMGKGGYSSTSYGQEYAALLRRRYGGPRLVRAA